MRNKKRNLSSATLQLLNVNLLTQLTREKSYLVQYPRLISKQKGHSYNLQYLRTSSVATKYIAKYCFLELITQNILSFQTQWSSVFARTKIATSLLTCTRHVSRLLRKAFWPFWKAKAGRGVGPINRSIKICGPNAVTIWSTRHATAFAATDTFAKT